MDAARGFLMLLGLVIHAAMIYSPERWRVHDSSGGVGFAWLVSGIHSFRMQAFFFIAGFFTALGIDRQPIGEYLRVRGLRLMVPLVATLLTFNVLEFWLVRQLPPANSGPRADPLLHLWFLVDLSTLTLLATIALREDSRLYRSFASVTASAPNPVALLGLLTLISCGFVLAGVAASLFLGREPSQSWGAADLQ
jgi:glucan biosynthesis protein C